MNIYDCEQLAKNEGYDCATFDLVGINGRIRCKWLDAYYGMFFAGEDAEGFTMSKQVPDNLWVENFNASGDDWKGK